MDPATNKGMRGHEEERAQIGGVIAPTANKGDAQLFRLFLTPLEVWNKFVATGAAKAKFSWPKKIILSFLAGCYLSFGMAFAELVGGQLKSITSNDPGMFNLIYGFFGLPFGLTMIIIMGAELFTSDVTFMIAAWAEGKASMRSVIWNGVWCWFGNLCGSLWMVQMYVWAEVFTGRTTFATNLSLKKTSFGFGVTFVRGMLCNWLVNIGVWQALSAQDVTGKFVGVFIPVTIFVASGFEHCIANQFGIPMGIRLFSGVEVNDAIRYNFVPVTMGNIVAAVIFISGFYFFAIGTGHDKMVNWWNATMAAYTPAWLAPWLQTGDVSDGATPLPDRFIGDVTVHGGQSSQRGIFASLRGKKPVVVVDTVHEGVAENGKAAAGHANGV